jgi:hypothetical protein
MPDDIVAPIVAGALLGATGALLRARMRPRGPTVTTGRPAARGRPGRNPAKGAPGRIVGGSVKAGGAAFGRILRGR